MSIEQYSKVIDQLEIANQNICQNIIDIKNLPLYSKKLEKLAEVQYKVQSLIEQLVIEREERFPGSRPDYT